jgi:hypothetical protein
MPVLYGRLKKLKRAKPSLIHPFFYWEGIKNLIYSFAAFLPFVLIHLFVFAALLQH